jgi:hypothetical protein
MSDLKFSAPGWLTPASRAGDVPSRYFGVWSRTLLGTPDTVDTSTWVRWMQLGQWHVDLRVPQMSNDTLQGFSGTTRVSQVGAREMCSWLRLVDYQPPPSTLDEGWMIFETSERIREVGIHSNYAEVWERLPKSTGRRMALTEPARADGQPSARLFVSGDYLMRVCPAEPLGATFEISFGTYADGQLHVEASTIASLTDTCIGICIARIRDHHATVVMDSVTSEWTILERVET